MGLAKLFEEEVSTKKYSTARTNTGIQLQKDISNESKLIWVLQVSESQPPSSTLQSPTLEDLEIETFSFPGSSLSISPRG